MDTPTDRLILWLLRSLAGARLFAGVSVLVAGVPVFGRLSGTPLADAIAGILFQIAELSGGV